MFSYFPSHGLGEERKAVNGHLGIRGELRACPQFPRHPVLGVGRRTEVDDETESHEEDDSDDEFPHGPIVTDAGRGSVGATSAPVAGGFGATNADGGALLCHRQKCRYLQCRSTWTGG